MNLGCKTWICLGIHCLDIRLITADCTDSLNNPRNLVFVIHDRGVEIERVVDVQPSTRVVRIRNNSFGEECLSGDGQKECLESLVTDRVKGECEMIYERECLEIKER